MNEPSAPIMSSDWTKPAVLILSFVLVVLGMMNNLPNIPGLLELVQSAPGLHWVPRLSKFDGDYFFPLSFALMMVIALLNLSFAKAWGDHSSPKKALGWAIDVLMFITIAAIVFVYFAENDQVCLLDVLNGERARLMDEMAARRGEYIQIFGVAPADELPDCITRLDAWIVPFFIGATAILFVYVIRYWGFPIVMVALVALAYTIFSSAAWYFDWSSNRYLTTAIGTISDGTRNFNGAVIGARNAIIQDSNGLMGQFLDITMNTVFPYVVLGALFGASAGGQALIKLAIVSTRRLRGGPAHAAIVGSALFGTVSGGPVVNVLGTGTLTIPMMIRSGFPRSFSGGVEAAASSGGQIMPPVMGVAAFVLAALSTVSYSKVIMAAFLPAVAYFFCLFLVVVLEARRRNIQPVGELAKDQYLTRRDWMNLLMIAGPILTILFLLLIGKDWVGTGFLANLFGHDQTSGEPLPWLLKLLQNSVGDPDSAGFWAVIVLIALLFIDPEIRAHPGRVLRALANAGEIIASLFLLLIAVAVIDVCVSFTNVTGILTVDVLNWLKSASEFSLLGMEFEIGGPLYLLLALFIAMIATLVLGMGMPTLPAYVNVILIIGPLLVALGTSNLTAHMFVFYFAVASAITPPVAIAAFAASTISKSDPVMTGVAAVRVGFVMFLIPFIFAFYPEILLIKEAQIMQPLEGGTSAAITYLPGYDGQFHWGRLGWLALKLVLALYLIATVLSRFDRKRLLWPETALRLMLAVLILLKVPTIAGPAMVAAIGLLIFHAHRSPKQPSGTQPA